MAGMKFGLDLETDAPEAKRFADALDHVDKVLRRVEASLGKTDTAVEETGKASAKAAREIDDVGEAAEKAGKKADGFWRGVAQHFTADAIIGGLKRIGGAMLDFARDVFHSAGEAERMQISLNALLGEAQADVELEWLDRLGQQLPETGDDLAVLERRLLAVGAPLDAMRPLMLGIADIAAITGESVESIADGMGEVLRSGEISGRILRPLMMKEEDALDALAKKLGKTTAETKKLMSEGKIAGLDAVYSILHAVAGRQGGEIGGLGMKLGDTAEERLKDLGDAWEGMWKAGVIKAGPSISAALRTITEGLTSGDLGEKLGKGIEKLADRLTKIDWAAGAQRMVDLLGRALSIAEKIARVVGGPSEDEVAKSEGGFVTLPNGQRITRAAAGSRWAQLRNERVGFFGRLLGREGGAPSDEERLMESIATGKNDGSGAIRGMAGELVGMSLAEGIKKGATDNAEAARMAGELLGVSAIDATKKTLDAHSPSRKYEELGRWSAEGYARGMGDGGRVVAPAVDEMLAFPSPSAYAPAPTGMARGATISMPVSITVHGGDGGIAEEIADRLRIVLPGQLQAALRQAAVEAGV